MHFAITTNLWRSSSVHSSDFPCHHVQRNNCIWKFCLLCFGWPRYELF